MREAVLALGAVFFAGMGVSALVVPAALVRPFGLVVSSATSRSEVRAVYGGFGLAVAGVLGWCAAGDDPLRTGAAWAVGIALAGMAAGRLISRLVDSPTAFYPIWFYFLVEAVAGGLIIGVVRP
ncbi:DUF4345 domain-containing protein [Saccharopolyspora dendranthemae]|uniref:Uncharacterized protein DUF4345 n=1 Tax=Saccharopolyspora dendranthemae TaxID=1181886 RepID=A0A561V8E1_9PSEU|nr:DUF4345 domain-containing protein [Saccharopolyspora dendranthemae]TWG07873.1 uncharacterized protein DUF4345 [Saccharopolyspora dendranthemae]